MDFTEPANWRRIRSDAEQFVAEHVTRQVIENERRTGDGVDRALSAIARVERRHEDERQAAMVVWTLRLVGLSSTKRSSTSYPTLRSPKDPRILHPGYLSSGPFELPCF